MKLTLKAANLRRQPYLLPLALALGAFLIIVTGGWIRISDAGESCPDWPTCFGQLHPWVSEAEQTAWWEAHPGHIDSRGPQHRYSTLQIFTEWFHRLLVGLMGLAVLASHYLVWRRREGLEVKVQRAHIVATGLLFVQAIVGYITVDFDNVPWSVALHLALALGFTTSLLWVGLLWWQSTSGLPPALTPQRQVAARRDRLLGLAALLVLTQLLFGALLATGQADREACGVGWTEGWPLCRGELWPGLQTSALQVQLLHRGFALLVGVAVAWSAWQLRRSEREAGGESQLLGRLTLAATGLFGVNLLVGGLYKVLAGSGEFPGWASLLHLVVGSLAFLSLATAYLLCAVSESSPEPAPGSPSSAVE